MTAPDVAGLRALLAKAEMPVLAVEGDDRHGMEWNDHIVHADGCGAGDPFRRGQMHRRRLALWRMA